MNYDVQLIYKDTKTEQDVEETRTISRDINLVKLSYPIMQTFTPFGSFGVGRTAFKKRELKNGVIEEDRDGFYSYTLTGGIEIGLISWIKINFEYNRTQEFREEKKEFLALKQVWLLNFRNNYCMWPR